MLDIFNPEHYRNFEGDLIPTRVKQIEKQREMEMERKKQRQLEYERKMEEQVITKIAETLFPFILTNFTQPKKKTF